MRPTRHQHILFVLALIVTASGCARASQPADQAATPSFVFRDRMGLVRWNEDRGCLAMVNAAVTPGTKVALVDQPVLADVPTVKETRVGERLPKSCDDGLEFGSVESLSFYAITTTDGTTPSGITFAILDPAALPLVRNGIVEADLDADGARESFRVCASTESLHFMIWTGSPAQGRPRWRGVFYAGYDMDPTCNDQDTAGMAILDKERIGG